MTTVDLPRLSLVRCVDAKTHTYGYLTDAQGKKLCVTLEEPWRDENKDGLSDRNVSRIPAGTYVCFRRTSLARGIELFQLEGVPGRSDIQIHKGNTVDDTQGCILVGSAFGMIRGKHAVLGSAPAFERFMDAMKGCNRFLLTITEDFEPLDRPPGAARVAA
jgi:hypothetical protein